MFDWPWSGVHFVSGLVIGLMMIIGLGLRSKNFWVIGVSLLLFWELVERSLHFLDVYHHQAIATLKASVGGFAFAPETALNATGDMIVGCLGIFIAHLLLRKKP
jgi:hypothetical protein